MSSPNPSNSSAQRKDEWLGRYLRLQVRYDARVNEELVSAAEAIRSAILDLEQKRPSISVSVRKLQLTGAQGVLSQILKEMYQSLGDMVRAGSADAAKEAALARLAEEAPLFDQLTDDASKRAKMEESMLSASARGVQAMMTRILKTEQPLSRRLYHSEALARGMVSRKVSQHLAMGSSADEMARDLREFVHPRSPGGVSYVAKRLARTEMNNAFHAQSIADAMDRPWVQHMEWYLSKSHPEDQNCMCEVYARQKNFTPSQVPNKPHPNCFCYVVPAVIEFDQFLSEMDAGRYDEWAKEHGL